MSTATEHVNGRERTTDPVAQAEADAIRSKSYAEAEAARIKAEGEAEAAKTRAIEEAEKQRLTNERARLKLERDQVAHERHVAEQAAKTAKAKAEKEKTEKADAEQEKAEAERAAEQKRSEEAWKWGARSIYAIGLIIAAPIQFLAFWDKERPFLVAAPALLEGFALVLAFGAAWAVAHRRDVAPFRVGIMAGALIAAGINVWHGWTDPAIGVNAGVIGGIASLGGPAVLMAYEHSNAQMADGIPSFRERRATEKVAKQQAAEKQRAQAEREEAQAARKAAEEKAAKERAAKKRDAEIEQQLRDEDRQHTHPQVWEVAESLRSARGEAVVTEALWSDAWYLVTGSKRVGITADIEASARAAQALMKTTTDMPVLGASSQVESQKGARQTKRPDQPDGRRHNRGTPPRRTAGDTQPYSALARTQAAHEQTPERS